MKLLIQLVLTVAVCSLHLRFSLLWKGTVLNTMCISFMKAFRYWLYLTSLTFVLSVIAMLASYAVVSDTNVYASDRVWFLYLLSAGITLLVNGTITMIVAEEDMRSQPAPRGEGGPNSWPYGLPTGLIGAALGVLITVSIPFLASF